MDDWPTERVSMPRGGLRRLSNRLGQFENFCCTFCTFCAPELVNLWAEENNTYIFLGNHIHISGKSHTNMVNKPGLTAE